MNNTFIYTARSHDPPQDRGSVADLRHGSDGHQREGISLPPARLHFAMKKNQFLHVFLIVSVITRSSSSWADDDDANREKNPATILTKEICDPDKSNADGVYKAKLGRDVLAAYVMCSGTTSLIVTVNTKMGRASGTMAHVLPDGENVSFLSFDPAQDAAKTSPGGLPLPEMTVNIEALKMGVLTGEYSSLRVPVPLSLSIPKTESFKKLSELVNPNHNWTMVPGRYVVASTPNLKAVIRPPAYITIRIINGIQRVFLIDQGKEGVLLNGMEATENNNFGDVFAASGGVDDTRYGAVFETHVCGHLLRDDPDTIEFWYINSLIGINGPFYAKRDTSPSKTLDQKISPQSASKVAPLNRPARTRIIARPR
jgi:hypothetical protein